MVKTFQVNHLNSWIHRPNWFKWQAAIHRNATPQWDSCKAESSDMTRTCAGRQQRLPRDASKFGALSRCISALEAGRATLKPKTAIAKHTGVLRLGVRKGTTIKGGKQIEKRRSIFPQLGETARSMCGLQKVAMKGQNLGMPPVKAIHLEWWQSYGSSHCSGRELSHASNTFPLLSVFFCSKRFPLLFADSVI